LAPPLPSATASTAGVSVLPAPTFRLSKLWLQAAVSVPCKLPTVIVGMPVELVVPS
jgi:hypothetical protein